MEDGLSVKNGIVIPNSELEISASRASGPGGQHVNKTSTKITVRWNVVNSVALTEVQKERVLQKLENRLTKDGDLIVHNSSSRSQGQNKESALLQLASDVRHALHVQKKRMKTRVPKKAKETRLQSKSRRSVIKKLRSKKISED